MAGPVPGPVGTAAGRPAHRDSPGKTRPKEHQMTGNARPATRILGSLRSADGKGRGAQPFDEAIEATLTADGDQTILVIEVQGMPLDKIAFYGAGWQIHAENLAAYLAGRERGDTEARWDDLVPPYQDLAANIG